MDKGIINRKNKGFSLIELVIVITVLSILGAIAIPYFDSLRKRVMIAAVKENITTIATECLIKNMLVKPGEYGLNFRDLGRDKMNKSFSNNGVVDIGSTGYPYYSGNLGFTSPLMLDSNCLSISARSRYFNNTSIGEMPHFQIFFNPSTMQFEKLCKVDSERTFNNGTCDTPRWVNGKSKRKMWWILRLNEKITTSSSVVF